jgi:hypothetical protein
MLSGSQRLRGVAFLYVSYLSAQMVNPAIDAPGEPFSFPAFPTDVIGVPDDIAATLITPEGYLYTGYGELMFFVGHPPEPVSQRIRTLKDGYLPIVQYQYRDDVVTYQVTAFAFTLDQPVKKTINFIRVVATNGGSAPRTSYFSVALRYTGEVNARGVGHHRFRRPVPATEPGAYFQVGAEFDPDWEYGFEDDCALRGGRVVYMFPLDPRPTLWLTRGTLYEQATKMRVLPTTPVLLAQYRLTLGPGESRTLDFKMPLQPLATAEADALRSANVEVALRRTTEWWRRELNRGLQIELAERKVIDTLRANLAYIMIARDRVGENYIQTVNKFQYHAFWLRDGAYLVRAYDVMGYHDLARKCLEFFFRFQRPDGNFVSQEGQYDGWGQALWAFGQHYRFTRDREFARRALPAVRRAVEWLRMARRSDPLRLIPPTNPRDAEFTKVAAHITGHNLWALTGLKNAIYLAKAAGSTEDVHLCQAEHDDLANVLWKILDEVTARTNGYIPPGLDQPGGQDWGNMNLLYPEQNLPPFDPKVTATIERTRAKYEEGLMTYAGRLHHYLTMKNTENLIVRAEQQKALEELYAILVHTSATHAGFEWGVKPWGDRDFGNNLMPHGWFGAKYISVIRNMLLREDDDELHLLSVLSPAWTAAGKQIKIRNAPTYFGRVNFEVSFRTRGMSATLNPTFELTPRRIVIHLPWFVKVKSAQADGEPVGVHDGKLVLPASVRQVDVSWSASRPRAGLSYFEAVEAYKRDYSARYEAFLKQGSPVEEPLRLY